ncbi:MAG: DegT/DnrJ/EryC1/StrS family aminotransferase [Boseongicola sp.]
MFPAQLPRYRIYGGVSKYLTLLRHFSESSRSQGPIRELEELAALRFDASSAVAVPQNRVGIYLAIKSIVRPGKKVILSPYTLSDVINMVVCAGAVPIFADIDRTTSNIDPDEIEKLIDSDTDAVMVTHLHGLICDMDRIIDICKKNNLALIEDAAQACGAHVGDRYAGTFGDAGVFSFGMYKNINSFYGGMVLTKSPETDARIRELMRDFDEMPSGTVRSKAISGFLTDVATHPLVFRLLTYWVFRYAYLNNVESLNRRVRIEDDPKLKREFPAGYQARLRPVQARLVLNQFDDIEKHLQHRIDIARIYDDGLSDIDHLVLPPFFEDGRHGYLHYPIQAEHRDDLIRHMVQNGRDVAIQHLRDCSSLDCFKEWHRDCPVSKKTASELILLPTYPLYTLEEARKNVETIRSFFGASSK